jgi:soluble lytic murein transglycosylase-like protein
MRILLFGACFAVLSSSTPASGAHLRDAATVYYADAYADHYRVPRALVHAIITQESGWNPHAVSSKGAAGLMQLMPETAEGYGVLNPYAVTESLSGGIRYLADLLVQFRGEMRLVVAAYYCGAQHLRREGVAYHNAEVVTYVESVRRLYEHELSKEASRNALATGGQ